MSGMRRWLTRQLLPLFIVAACPIVAAAQIPDSLEIMSAEIVADGCAEEALSPIALGGQPALPAGLKVLVGPSVGAKRLFGVIPNYRSDELQETYKPISSREKYHIARQDSFDWPNYLLLAGYAAQSQVASGGFSKNGGMGGFAKFYARSVGDQIIGSYLTEAIMPSLLHEDPRFFRMGRGSFWRRSYWATSRIVIAQKDDGSFRFNISEVLGNAAVVAATSVYYPQSQSASEGFERFSMALGNDMIS